MANCPRPSLPRHPLRSTASAPRTALRNDGGGYFLAQHRGDIEVDRSTRRQEHQTRPGKIDGNALTAVIEEKRQTIRETDILEFIPLQSGLESVGGLSNLKQWVKLRSHSFTDEAREY